VAEVTFSDSDSTPVPKFLNPDPGPAIFQISESDSCSDSGYNHWSNRNLPMFLLQKRPHRLLLLPKFKSDSGSVFSWNFDSGSGSERKTQNPAGVHSGNPDPVPTLRHICGIPQRPLKLISAPPGGASIVTRCHNMNEFIGVLLNVLFLKSIAIMQTNLCIADLEMLFTTLRTCANHTSWQENRVTSFRKRYPHRSFAEP